MLEPKYLDNPGSQTKSTALTFSLNSWYVFWKKSQLKVHPDVTFSCYRTIIAPPQSIQTKFYICSVILMYFRSYSICHWRSKCVCMWLLLKSTSLRKSIRSGINFKYWNTFNVMRVLHCISVRKGEMQNYFTHDSEGRFSFCHFVSSMSDHIFWLLSLIFV